MTSLDAEDVVVFIHASVVRRHHIYKETWAPSVKVLPVRQEQQNQTIIEQRAI